MSSTGVRHFCLNARSLHECLAAGHIKCVSAGPRGLDWIGLVSSCRSRYQRLLLSASPAATHSAISDYEGCTHPSPIAGS